jgi:predicted RNA-binding Zn-ribbon protein involved in translation (DUF1610 family)
MARPKRIVFRIEKGQGCGLAVVLGGFALVAAIALKVTTAVAFWGPVFAAVLVGYLIGNAAKKRKCSHCGEQLHGDAETCPQCGGIIKGNVASMREIPAAKKALKNEE